MRSLVAVALLGTGCAQLLSIDETTGPSAAIELERVSVGSTVTRGALALQTAPTFLVAGRSVAGTPGAAGVWTAGGAAASEVVYTAPDVPTPYQHALAMIAPRMKASFVAFEHPASMPAPSSAQLALDVQLPSAVAAGQAFKVIAVGAWTQHDLTGAEVPAPGAAALQATLPYSAFTGVTASPPARITHDDSVVVARYDGAALAAQLVVTPFDQSDATSTLSGTMLAVTPDTPVSATIDAATVVTRYGGIKPAVSAPQLGWQIVAAPGHDVGAAAGVRLIAGGIGATDTMFSSTFANPFLQLGWKPILAYTTSASRTYTLGGATVTLGASLTTLTDPTTGSTLDLPAALPTSIAVGGMAMTADGMLLAVDPTGPVDIAITADTTSSTWYSAEIDELAVVGSTATQTPVIAVSAPGATLTLPPNTLRRGHTYAVVARCFAGGYPNAGSGDLQTIALPLSSGSATSGVFTIAP